MRVRQHPDKTTIGRIARGFDFLGYRFSSAGLAVARQTVERCAARICLLYEQGAATSRIGDYVRRWVRAGLRGMEVELGWGARPGTQSGINGSVIPSLCFVQHMVVLPAVAPARQISQYSS